MNKIVKNSRYLFAVVGFLVVFSFECQGACFKGFACCGIRDDGIAPYRPKHPSLCVKRNKSFDGNPLLVVKAKRNSRACGRADRKRVLQRRCSRSTVHVKCGAKCKTQEEKEPQENTEQKENSSTAEEPDEEV